MEGASEKGSYLWYWSAPPPPLAISQPLQSPPRARETVTSMFF